MCSVYSKLFITCLLIVLGVVNGAKKIQIQSSSSSKEKHSEDLAQSASSLISQNSGASQDHEDKSNRERESVYDSYGPSFATNTNYYPPAQYTTGNLDSYYYAHAANAAAVNIPGKYSGGAGIPARALDSLSPSPLPYYYSGIARQGRYPPIVPIPDYALDNIPGMSHSDYAVALEPPFDNMYMASGGHGGGGHGGGHGHSSGHSHGHGGYGGGGHSKTVTNYKVSAVNTDAIGLLGLLGLLSILQAVLLSLTTTTAAGRRRRDVNGVEIDPETEMVNHISRLVLPSLNVIASAQCNKIPMNCTHHEICRANNLLVNQMGGAGGAASERITEAISQMLGKSNDKLSKELLLAGEFGRNGVNQCQDVYPICKELEKGGAYSLPLLLKKGHPLYYDHKAELNKLNKVD